MAKTAAQLGTQIQADFLEHSFSEITSENVTQFLTSLYDITKQHGGISTLSDTTGLNRQHLYRSFASTGNPKLQSLLPILQGLGYTIGLKRKLYTYHSAYNLEELFPRFVYNDEMGRFLTTLHEVAREQGGISSLSSRIGINRQNLYRTFSSIGNPKLKSFIAILNGLGYAVTICKVSNDNVQ